MVKKALTLLTSILIALHLLMPFNIYADTLPQSEIVGVTYNKIDQDVTYVNSSGTYTYIYEVEVLLKNKYVGVVDGTLSYSYAENPQSQTVTSSKRTYVNGDSFKLNVSIVQFGSSYSGSSPMYSASFLVNAQNTNVTKYEDLTSIETAVSILEDIYTNSNDIENLSTNQLAELEKIVQNTSLANEYLDTLSKFRQFRFPIESFSFINSFFSDDYKNYIDFYEFGDYTYPLFENKNDLIYQFTNNVDYSIVLGINRAVYGFTTFNNYFNLQNATLKSISVLYQSNYKYNGSTLPFYIIKLTINRSSGPSYLRLNSFNDIVIMPIYSEESSHKNISTDFALQFGLSNELLDNLNIIANGTNASHSAAQSTDSANSQLQTDSNTLFSQEDNFKSDMNNAMQNVNNTFRLQDMGTKFVSSAQWVRTQYENLTNNTPFASLITFSLITGLALILLGKVYK